MNKERDQLLYPDKWCCARREAYARFAMVNEYAKKRLRSREKLINKNPQDFKILSYTQIFFLTSKLKSKYSVMKQRISAVFHYR
jgi:hypothetical protein